MEKKELREVQAERLKRIREHYNVRTSRFASEIGVDRSTLWLYDRGERTIKVEALMAIWEKYGVSPDEVLGIKPLRF